MMRKELQDLVLRKYAEVAEDLLGPLVDLLHAARVHCDGDLDKYLILLVIATRTAQQGECPALAQARLDSGRFPLIPACGINIRSIADSVEMPKETARRKVQELIEAGWIKREGQLLYPTARAYEELTPLREASARQAVRYYEAVGRLAGVAG